MRIYKATIISQTPPTTRVLFVANKKDAFKLSDPTVKSINVETIYVPDTRGGLIAFLNDIQNNNDTLSNL